EGMEYVRNDGYALLSELLARPEARVALEALAPGTVALLEQGDDTPAPALAAVREAVEASRMCGRHALDLWDDWVRLSEEAVPVTGGRASGPAATPTGGGPRGDGAGAVPGRPGGALVVAGSSAVGEVRPLAAPRSAAREQLAWWQGEDAEDEEGPAAIGRVAEAPAARPPAPRAPCRAQPGPDPWAGAGDPWASALAGPASAAAQGAPPAGGVAAAQSSGAAEEPWSSPEASAAEIRALAQKLPRDAPRGVREFLAAWATEREQHEGALTAP
ncbi:unnamed protein product, partial [Prorocentrum cordatum]